MYLKTYIALFCFFTTFSISGKSFIPIKETDEKLIAKYLSAHSKFSKKLCLHPTEPKFWKIMRSYFGYGYYVPLAYDDSLDKEVIELFLPTIKRKIEWITGNINFIKNLESFSGYLAEIGTLRLQLDELVEYKTKFYKDKKIESKKKIRNESLKKYKIFKDQLKMFFDRMPFMVSFDYPVDHLKLRSDFDKFKFREDKIGVLKSNRTYFYRKIVEDGAQNPNNTKSDIFLRTTINTVSLALSRDADFIPEELRYDISSILEILENHLKRGKKYKLARLKEWKERIRRKHIFYKSLLTDKLIRGDKTLRTKNYVLDKSRARFGLKKFVLDKQKDVYNFWINYKEIYRALYVIETILFNEVGSIDGTDALERKDVVQVVLNRKHINFYSTIPRTDSLYERLKSLKLKNNIDEYKWLNLLFKEGEFSFTYYFISSNIRVFCPDMSKRGRKLRRQNLEIALEMLRNPRSNFNAVRYFSRASMIGRINMAKLWSDFEEMPEQIGVAVEEKKKFIDQYRKGNYKLLYHFRSIDFKSYKVLEISDRKFVMPVGSEKLYTYRDPNHFRYFKKK